MDTTLDAEAVGKALIMLAVISRLMGHASIAHTARDYLLPHETGHDGPEWQFVLDLVANGTSPLITDEIAGEALVTAHLPPLGE